MKKSDYIMINVLLMPLLLMGVLFAAEGAISETDVNTTPAATSQPAKAAPNQLLNLNETPDFRKNPRFKLTDRIWPEKPGKAHICLWKNDAYAAFSFSVDDNMANDHAWWAETSKKYGFPVTWFVITDRVGTVAIWGTWKGFGELIQQGNDVQSHTYTHIHPEKPHWKGIVYDYTRAIEDIQKNIPNHKVVALAYPGGKNSKLNNRDEAAKYYAVARGGRGSPNAANAIDYMGTNSSGSWHMDDDARAQWTNLKNIFEPNKKVPTYKCYLRGWAVMHTHGVKEDSKKRVIAIMDYLKSKGNDVWVGKYADVGRYGQERDTATLKTISAAKNKIALSLADRMKDELFTVPLTIKVRLYDNWKAVAATQNGKPINAKFVLHEEKPYALIQAVPDKGEIALIPRP